MFVWEYAGDVCWCSLALIDKGEEKIKCMKNGRKMSEWTFEIVEDGTNGIFDELSIRIFIFSSVERQTHAHRPIAKGKIQ